MSKVSAIFAYCLTKITTIMIITEMSFPVAELYGALNEDYCIRRFNGKLVLCRKSISKQPPTAKQIEARRKFAENVRNGTYINRKGACLGQRNQDNK